MTKTRIPPSRRMFQILSIKKYANVPAQSHNGSWWSVQILSTKKYANLSPQSHQRQLVVGSDPFYKEVRQRVAPIPPTAAGGRFRSFLQRSPPACRPNPTNGSWWSVQILSTKKSASVSPQSHQRQLVVGSDPFYKCLFSILRRAARAALGGHTFSRKDLNNPPTAVGGIQRPLETICRGLLRDNTVRRILVRQPPR